MTGFEDHIPTKQDLPVVRAPLGMGAWDRFRWWLAARLERLAARVAP